MVSLAACSAVVCLLHPVFHPRKPNKLRIVFDCSAEFKNQVLNCSLLQGSDQGNSLTGVLCRFRENPVAISCDVEAMFHHVRVAEEDRDLLRFLWWTNGDTRKPSDVYRMRVHLFGATSSPACANLALRENANRFMTECGEEASQFVKRNFYVDDGLKSVNTAKEALQLINASRDLCARGGFNLHKFLCNDKSVLAAIPPELTVGTYPRFSTYRVYPRGTVVCRIRYTTVPDRHIDKGNDSARNPLHRELSI